LTVIESDFVQPLASFTVTVCDPALTLLKVFGEVAAANAPPSRLMVYGPVPPPKVAVTLPSLPPLQLMSVLVRLSVTAVGSLTVIEVVFEQPPVSVTVTLCDPALRPLKVFGDVAVAAAPPSMLAV